MNERWHTLEEHDVTDLIGLRVVVANVAIQITYEDGDESVEIPDLEELSAAAAVLRCLTNVRLLGSELRSIRRIAGWTAADLAQKLGERTSSETISRWENDKQPMGGYAEKVFRLVVCEELKNKAPGIPYDSAAIARLIVVDPWRAGSGYQVPPMTFERVKVEREKSREIVDMWRDTVLEAA